MNRVNKIILSTILLVLIAHLFISSPAQVALAQGGNEPSTPAQSEDIPDNVEFDRLTIEHGLSNNGALGIVHVTIADGIRAVDQAKREGVKVTVETCPHYLFFDEDVFVRIGPAAKCAPPIRSRAEVEKLWDCVLAGMVDTIASDHSPCPTADKEKGMDNIWKAWGGITGIQAMLPAMLTEGVHKRGLPLPALVKMMSANPARIFGLYPQKGFLMPGSDADIAVIDLQKTWTLSAEDLFSKHQQSAYVGYTFKGAVDRTIVRGSTVYLDGKIIVEPGYGRLMRRRN